MTVVVEMDLLIDRMNSSMDEQSQSTSEDCGIQYLEKAASWTITGTKPDFKFVKYTA